MKKAYVKPYIAVESFQLNAAIAASCSSSGYISIGRSENACGYDEWSDNHWQFFNYDNCEVDLTDGATDDHNGTECYHGPFEASMTFIAS